ncbi:GNAT family N-acetyltransferase [Paenibacillus sp. N1-5-1-14]|uniref:GNAT family N-acetyltransferase n=1 Tax=Paenibacillus radicibacter TaxID=2972488 RepID=UPI0021599242|nr:GNAT family N-acetyltransferase [Paenibacillus radicibacter]MCR8641284.1 GNAT family N-acetyltransferase [Paenibacillus radicibacter]
MAITMETHNLMIRPLRETDSEAMFDYFSKPEVMQYFGNDPHATIEDTRKVLHTMMHGENDGRARWGIVRKGDDAEDTVIGTIGYHLHNLVHKRCEIGYELHPDFWGHGYMSEAVRAIIQFGFTELGLERIAAVVYLDNVGSIRVLEKQGFEKEGILRKYIVSGGKSHDVYVLSLLRSDWESRN